MLMYRTFNFNKNPGDDMVGHLYWNVTDDHDRVEIAVVIPKVSGGYIGVGFNAVPYMKEADAIIAWINGNGQVLF